MPIGDNIRKYRLLRGLTMQEVADRLSTTKQTIYKYENGIITNIPSDKIELLASLFGISPADLMGWTDETPEQPPEDDDPEFITLAHRLKRLDPADRKRVEDMIKLMFPEDFE